MCDWRQLYPFESHFLEVEGGRLHYVDEGRGEPLVLVHGNPTWSFHWRELIVALRSRYRLVAIDHLGCGPSDKPQGWSYRLADHVANLRRLVDALDLRGATLLAQDWGGAIGLGAAVDEPDRFGRFVLFNTAAFHGGRMPLRIRVCRTPVLGRLGVRGANAFLRAALRMTMVHRERLTPQVRAGILAPYGNWRDRVAIERFVADIPVAPSHASYGTLSHIEARLPMLADCPVQLIWGMRDWCFTPWFLERFRTFFPRAEIERVADAGHWVVEDAHERIGPWITRFLTAHPVAAARTAG
jgi:haloalkane dehalogenase